ncbi:MAG: S41 family peptidase [Fimbriimonas sp.]
MISLLLAGTLFVQKPVPVSPQLKRQIIAGIGTTLKQMAFVPGVDFTTWPKVARRNQDWFDEAKDSTAFMEAVNDALSEYGVSHLSFFRLPATFGQKVEAFGFTTTAHDGKTVVSQVFDGTKAEKAGLHAGTVLETFTFPNYPDTDTIEVEIRDGANRLRAVQIEKESFIPRVLPTLTWGDQTTCVLTVPSFSQDNYDQKGVEQLVRNAARFPNLILDLRGNPGGNPECTMHLLGAFLPAGTRVGSAISREMLKEFTRVTGKTQPNRTDVVRWAPKKHALEVAKLPGRYKGHLAVLVDGGSGSGSEVAAQALRDYANAPIFGRPSAGAVLFSNMMPLPGGYFLGFPWRDYWTAKGGRIEGNPIQPDVLAAEGPEATNLTPWPLKKRAIEWLNAKFPTLTDGTKQ